MGDLGGSVYSLPFPFYFIHDYLGLKQTHISSCILPY